MLDIISSLFELGAYFVKIFIFLLTINLDLKMDPNLVKKNKKNIYYD